MFGCVMVQAPRLGSYGGALELSLVAALPEGVLQVAGNEVGLAHCLLEPYNGQVWRCNFLEVARVCELGRLFVWIAFGSI